MNRIRLLACFLLLGIIQAKPQEGMPSLKVNCFNDNLVEELRCDKTGKFFTVSTGDSTFSITITLWSDYSKYGPESNLGRMEIGELSGDFVNGRKEGIWWMYDGVYLSREDTYKGGQLHGTSRVFAKDGELLYQTVFVNGTGDYKEYNHDNKLLFMEGRLQKGKREGEWRYYFEAGGLSHIETYKGGMLHGPFKVFNQEGEELYSTLFKNGTGWYKSLNVHSVLPSKKNQLLEEGRMEKGFRKGKWTKRRFNGELDTNQYSIGKPKPKWKRKYYIHLLDVIHGYGYVYKIQVGSQELLLLEAKY